MQTLNVSVATHLSCLKCDCSAPQLSNLPVWTCFCPSKYPMAHLLHEEVELLDVKWGFKDPRALLWEQSVSGSRRKAGCWWDPLDGICGLGTVTTPGTSSPAFVSLAFPPSNLTLELLHLYNAEICSILTSSLSLLTKKQDFSLLSWRDLKQWTN